MPFLDHKLVEFAFSLPVSLKLRNGAGKYVLRHAVAEKLPSALRVKKRPFVAASSETLGLGKGSEFSAHYLDSRAIRKTGLFNPHAVGGLRRSLPYLPRGSLGPEPYGDCAHCSGLRSRLYLNEMFCERFEDSAVRFNLSRPDSTLADGRI